jgi:hypothetical protein
MFVSYIETNKSGQIFDIASINSTTETQRAANFKENNNNQDKRVKNIINAFWTTFYYNAFFLFFVIFIGIIFGINGHNSYSNYMMAIFAIDIVTFVVLLPTLFFGYWKFVRKEPIPDGFYNNKDDEDDDEDIDFKSGFSESKSFATDPRFNSSPSNIFYRN